MLGMLFLAQSVLASVPTLGTYTYNDPAAACGVTCRESGGPVANSDFTGTVYGSNNEFINGHLATVNRNYEAFTHPDYFSTRNPAPVGALDCDIGDSQTQTWGTTGDTNMKLNYSLFCQIIIVASTNGNPPTESITTLNFTADFNRRADECIAGEKPEVGFFNCIPQDALAFTSRPILDATVNREYNYFATGEVNGGTVGLSFSIDKGTATWLTVSGSELFGTPSATDMGTYPIVITLTDNATGDAVFQRFTITVDVCRVDCNERPTAKFTVSSNRIGVGEEVIVDGSGSTDPDIGDTLSYKWTITDGGGTQRTATGVVARITFNEIGIGDITLVVNDGIDDSLAVSESIRINSFGDVTNRGPGTGGVICNGTNPVNGADGNKVQAESDYTGAGNFPLDVTRYYNSYSTKKAHLGTNWRHSYDQSIELETLVTPNQAYVFMADGSSVRFTQSATGWTPDAGVTQTLTDTATQWTVTDNNIIKTYTKVTGSNDALLNKIRNRLNTSQTLTYVDGLLNTVTDDFGRSLTFAYDTTGRLLTLTDPTGKVITYTYVNDNLDTVTYQDLTTRQYRYTNLSYPNHLTDIIDQNGKQFATWTYDLDGKANSSSHAGGANNVSIVYNADGTATFTDALGQVRTHTFSVVNGYQKLDKITGPACNVCGGRSQNNTYDVNGYRDLVTDFNGNVTDYDYSVEGLLEQLIEAQGSPEQRITQTQWDVALRVPLCVIAPRNTTHNVYTTKGQIQTETVYDTTDGVLFPDVASKDCAAITARADIASLNQRASHYTYLANGLLETIDGPRTDVQDITRYSYDIAGNVSTISNALQQITTLDNYDVHGRPQTIIDANGLITTITYDALGRRDIVTVGSEITNYDYYPNGTLNKVTLPDGSFLDYRYDDAQRLTDTYDQLGNHTRYTLSPLGNRIQTDTNDPTGALKRTQSAQYNLDNRLEKVIGAANQTTDYMAYDGNGNLEQVQDPEQNNSAFTYDALERLKTSTDALLGVTSNSYDAQDNLTSVTDPRGLITRYTFDGLGNRTQLVSPDTGTTNFTGYDASGNVLSTTDALGKTTTYQYDALDRLKLITYQDGTTTEYVYDSGVNGIGRLASISYNAGATSFAGIITDSWTYDSYGRVLTKTQTNEGVTLTTTYSYNAITGNLETETTPGGRSITYSYVDAQVNAISVDTQAVLSNIVYDPFGPPTNWTFGNGALVNRIFDKDGQLESYPESGVIMTNSYYPAGNVQSITAASATVAHAAYSYDALLRVITSDIDGATEAYDYDANSNRISQTIDLLIFSSTIDPASNQLQSRTGPPVVKDYVYDLVGNTISDGDHSYDYDARNRLISLDSNTVEYAINGQGQRIRKRGSFQLAGDLNGDGVVNFKDTLYLGKVIAGLIPATEQHDRNNDLIVGPLDVAKFKKMLFKGLDSETINFDTRFVYNSQGQLEGRYDNQGNVIEEYVWFAGQPVVILRGSQTLYIDSDHLGTPKSISGATQTVLWTWDADPYGRTLPTVDVDGNRHLVVVNLRFPGQYFDHESGLHYNFNRFYDPATGRYLESDPIGLAGGLNTYGYALGNPVNYYDPRGQAVAVGALCLVPGVGWVSCAAVAAGVAISACVYYGAQAIINYCSENNNCSLSSSGNAAGPAPYSHYEENEAYLFSPDPFGGNCKELARAIEILRAQIKWRRSDLNPNSISYGGHVTRIALLEAALRKLEQASRDICNNNKSPT